MENYLGIMPMALDKLSNPALIWILKVSYLNVDNDVLWETTVKMLKVSIVIIILVSKIHMNCLNKIILWKKSESGKKQYF